MRKLIVGAVVVLGLLVGLNVPLAGQTLSQQVLQLLTRINSWTASNTFYNLHIPLAAVPSDTTTRIYADLSGNLYYQTTLLAAAGGGTTPHNLLSTTHPDTVAASPTRGSVVVGNATPAWARVTPTTGFVQYNGTDTVFSTSLANGTAIPAAQLTGTIAAISGVNLTNLNASNLASGTVPLARISGLLNAQIDAAAAIAYSKLNLAGLVNLSTDTAATALPFAKGGTGLTAAADDRIPLSSGSAWVAAAIPNCVSATTALAYTAASNAFSCQSLTVGSGTVTSVALSAPAIFSVAGSPVTTTGTLAVTLANQTANTIWSGPNTGAAAAPTFRAMVNADLPLSGVAAGTYPSVTVNTRGVVTAASATVNLATVGGATILPAANGGLGIATVTASTIPVASGAAWVSTALPDCDRLLHYDTGTRLFACDTVAAFGTLVASTPLSITAAWNNVAVTFNQFLINVTDSASAATSTIADFQLGGVSKVAIRKDGIRANSGTFIGGSTTTYAGFGAALVVDTATSTNWQIVVTDQGAADAFGIVSFNAGAFGFQTEDYLTTGGSSTLGPNGIISESNARGAGAITGKLLSAGRNTSGSGAAGALGLINRSGTSQYIWSDNTGALRRGTSLPTESGSVSDTSGTLLTQTAAVAVGSLTTCNAAAKGNRSFVTDANATTFLSTVAAGGANNVPVVCDGTNWVIG